MKPKYLAPTRRAPKTSKLALLSFRLGCLLSAGAVSLIVSHSAKAATFTWDGGGAGVNWTTVGNWDGAVPTSNVVTDLIFAGVTNVGTSGTPLNQNVASSMLFNSITFDATAGNFFLGGSGFVITGGDTSTITQSSANNQSIANSITHTGSNNTTGALVLSGDGGGVVTLSGAINNGSGNRFLSITKSGTSTFVLTNATSTYTGATSVSAGTLSISGSINNSATINISGGILSTTGADKLANTAAVTVSGGTLTVGGADTVGSLTMSSGSIGGSNTLTATSYALSGGIVDGNLGAGAMTVSGATALNGTAGAATVNISAGTLTLGSSDRLANGATVTVSGSGILNTGTALTDAVSVFNMSGGSLIGTGTITATTYGLSGGTVTGNLGTGTLNSSGTVALNGTTGATSVNVTAGTLTLGSANRMADGATVTVSGGTLALGANSDTVSIFNMSSGAITGIGPLTATTYGLSGGTVTGNLGTGTLNSSGNVALNGTAGATAVNVTAGTLALGSADRLDNGAAVTVTGGTLDIATFSDTVGAVTLSSGSINGTGGTLTGSSYSLTNSGSVTAILAGSGTLTKSGSGTATLSGTNTYTGITSIDAGTLVVNGDQSSATGAVSVASIAALFGTGNIGGATTIHGTQSSGSSAGAVGTQTFSNSLSYSSDSIFEWDINVTGGVDSHDKLDANSLSGSGAEFKIVGSGDGFAAAFWESNHDWTAADLFGSNNVNVNLANIFNSANTATNFGANSVYGTFSFTNNGGTGNQLTWTAVPEPTTALAGILLGAGLLRRRRQAV